MAGAAAIGAVGLVAGVWLAPVALAALVLAVRRDQQRYTATLAQAGTFVAVLAFLSLQSLAQARAYLEVAQDTVTSQQEFGNLLGPLRYAQMFGVWLVGDYRQRPEGRNEHLTYALIGIVILAAVLGVIWAVRRRAWAPLFFIGISLLGWAYVTRRGSPWADGKALMIVSPAVMLAAMLGPAGLFAVRRRVEGAVLLGVVAAGVLASNALAYHDVSLAPRDRLVSSSRSATGSTARARRSTRNSRSSASTSCEDADPAGSSEGWQRRLLPLRDGSYARMGLSYDIDQFPLEYVRYYRTIVLRRSPTASRPPSNYRLAYSGRYYDVWQRDPDDENAVVAHASLGGLLDRGSLPNCRDVRSLARQARASGGRLAYVPTPETYSFVPSQTAFPPTWFVDPSEGHILRPRGPGKIQDSVDVRVPGTYDVWVMGSFGRGFDVRVDGTEVGRVRHHLNGRGQYQHAGSIELDRDRHIVELSRGGGTLRPGDGLLELLGPVVLVRRDDEAYRARFADPDEAGSLCGRRLDWFELVR